MGLDNFDTSGSSNTSSTNKGSVPDAPRDPSKNNSPSPSKQAFTDDPSVHPRGIKYQIKTCGLLWTTSFSQLRFDCGELVIYGAGDHSYKNGKTVAVHTCIMQPFGYAQPEENLPIWVTIWNFGGPEGEDNPVEEWYVEHTDGWQEELEQTVSNAVQELAN